jgi:CcmD family protein
MVSQDAPAPTAATAAPEGRSTEFVAVQGGGETTSAEALLVAAYAVIWLLLLGFMLMTWRRQRGLETRLATLEKHVPDAERGV